MVTNHSKKRFHSFSKHVTKWRNNEQTKIVTTVCVRLWLSHNAYLHQIIKLHTLPIMYMQFLIDKYSPIKENKITKILGRKVLLHWIHRDTPWQDRNPEVEKYNTEMKNSPQQFNAVWGGKRNIQ